VPEAAPAPAATDGETPVAEAKTGDAPTTAKTKKKIRLVEDGQ
jgi:hypothetical protein